MKVAYTTKSRAASAHRAPRSPLRSLFALLLILPAIVFGFAAPHAATAASSVDVWWPVSGAQMSGTQPFKAMIPGLDIGQYQMYWQVDGGGLVPMQDNTTGYPHKEASVDLSGWTWRGPGPYTVTFVAKQNGSVIAEQQEIIYNGGAAAPTPTQTQTQQVQTSAPTPAPTPAASPVSPQPAPYSIQPWWPVSGTQMSGTQPFKAMIPGLDIGQYQMYWQVDGGGLVPMQDNTTGYPHKEASVDVTNWHWQPTGVYTIAFVAKDANGNQIASVSMPVYVNTPSSAPAPVFSGSMLPQSVSGSSMPSVSGDPISGLSLYVNPNSEAANQAAQWQSGNQSGAAAMQILASQPTALWFGGWNSNIQNDVHNAVAAAASQGSVPVLVAYNIPERDCGGYSSGGASSASAYDSWIGSFASGIGSDRAIVILEPDALAQISCLSSSDQAQRLQLLSNAVSTLKQNPGTIVYIDAGHSGWVDAAAMADDLKQANIARANGFALDVSNFDATSAEESYGGQISQALGGAHFVIDTSRNGNGSSGQWCNPPGAAIGTKPTTSTGGALVDAFLWVKTPGESDGTCNGGPSAGTWWPQYALSLVQNAH